MIFLPKTTWAPKGTVYIFGGLQNMGLYQTKNFKYDINSDTFTEVEQYGQNDYRISFNLLPLISNRFILFVSND